MIKNIIFDFGAVLIPIEEEKKWEAFQELGALEELREQKEIFQTYEKGKISTHDFLQKIKPFFFRKKIFSGDLSKAWNTIVSFSIPEKNIDLLKKLKKDHRLFLMSNTNELNIQQIKINSGPFILKQFHKQFEKVYMSYEVGLHKPDKEFFQLILEENQLVPEETFFVDDNKRNAKAAGKLGIETWHFNPGEDSILDINKILQAKV